MNRMHRKGPRHAAVGIDRCAPQRLQRRSHARPDAPTQSQQILQQDEQIFQEQAEDSFKFCRTKRFDDDKFNKLLLTKAQSCPWTTESLFEKSDEVRKQKGLPLEPRMAGMAPALMTEASATRQVGAQMQI